MPDDLQPNLFADERSPSDVCNCGHARSLHPSVLAEIVGEDPNARCLFPGCPCEGFTDPVEGDRNRDIFDDALDLTRKAVADQVAEGLNRPQLPGFVRTSETSRASALASYFSRPSKKRRVFAFLEQRGDKGATCDEVEMTLGLCHQTASSTIANLKSEGFITPAGERKRLTRYQRFAEVLVVPPEFRGLVKIDPSGFGDAHRCDDRR